MHVTLTSAPDEKGRSPSDDVSAAQTSAQVNDAQPATIGVVPDKGNSNNKSKICNGSCVISISYTPQFKNYVATLFFNFLAEKAEFGRVYKPKQEFRGIPRCTGSQIFDFFP